MQDSIFGKQELIWDGLINQHKQVDEFLPDKLLIDTSENEQLMEDKTKSLTVNSYNELILSEIEDWCDTNSQWVCSY